jgi:cytoskeletal protein CcmA (bactofilin family)
MWNKRQDEPTPRPASAAPNPVSEAKKEPTPVSTMPFKPESESPRGSATIGKAVKINGQIFSKEDLYVDGDVEGNVELQEHKLTIGPNGKLQAGIRAREVVVLGQVHGNVEALDKIEIRKDARLVGDIKTARIIIEDGAYFKGSIDIVKIEQAKVPASAAAAGANPPRPQMTTPNSATPAAVGAEIKR